MRRYRRFFLAHVHFHHIYTSGGSSGEGFRIAHPHESHTPISYSSFIVTMALSGLVVSFQDIVMDNGINRRQTPDARQTIPLLKLSHLLLQANRGPPNNQPVLTHQAFELAYHMAVDIGSTVPLRRFSITRRLYRKKERRFVRFQSLGT